MQKAIENIHEEYLNKEETTLMAYLFKHHNRWQPSVQVEKLRLNFWMEYDRIQMSRVETTMVMVNIYRGVVDDAYWYNITSSFPHIFAFILCRPLSYEQSMEALLMQSLRAQYDILNLPIKNSRGQIDPKILELKLKTAAMVDLRNKGGYINRSETKNLTMLQQKTEHTHKHIVDSTAENKTAGQLEQDFAKQLKQLEEEARMQLPPPEPKFEKVSDVADAEYTDVEKREK